MIDISSDFVTFFFREGEAEQRCVSFPNGDTLTTAYVNGADWDEQDLDEALRRLGGVKVTINTTKNSARVSTEKTQKYRGPKRMLCLQIDQAPKLIEIGSFTFRPGDHLLIPVNEESEQALEDLRKTLGYLPSDYEISIMNFLRRPSLEMRIARLEQISGAGSGKNRDSARTLKPGQSTQRSWRPSKRLNALSGSVSPAILALVFLVLGYLIGQLTPEFLKSWIAPSVQGGDTSTPVPPRTPKIGTGHKTPAITVEPPPTEAAYGDTIEFRVHVRPGADSSNTPTGKVQLEKVGPPVTMFGESVALDGGGDAVLTTKKLPGGVQQMMVAYLGDGEFAPANSERLELNIKKIRSTTTLEVKKKDNQVVLSAKVICGQKATGKVDFYHNGETLLAVDLTNDVAETTQNLPTGQNWFSAQYRGNSYCDTSKSDRVTVK